MDTDFVEEIVSFNSDGQTLDFDRTNNILCVDDVGDPNVHNIKPEFFSIEDIDNDMSTDNCLMQTIESSYFANSGTRKNELNHMTKAVMESVPYGDGLQYLAAISSFSDNFKEMDPIHEVVIKEENDLQDSFESSDEETKHLHQEFQEYFDVQEEVVVQECPEQEIITQSWDSSRCTNIDTVIDAQVECMSSTENIDIPIPEGEEASFSVNPFPCDFCSRRFNRKSHLMNHMITHQSERPFCCALCGVRYRRKCDLAHHMKIHIGPNDGSNSGTDNQSHSVSKVMNKLMVMDRSHRRSVTPGEDSGEKRDIHQEQNTKNSVRGRGKGRGKSRGRPIKDRLLNLSWNSELYSKPHTCNPCGVSFTREKALLNHARLHHNQDSINIVTTQKAHSHSYELTILANPPNNDAQYPCDSCGENFVRFDVLKRHQRQHMKKEHGDVEEEVYIEALMCIHCGLFFKSMSELEVHTKQHLVPTNIPEKSKCLVCGETFNSTDELSDHVSQMHTDSLPEYSCKLCGKQCKDNKALQKHLMVHDTSDNKCIMCGKRFNSRARLKRHMITHREKGVTCDICGEKVADKRALMNHKASHANAVQVSRNSLTEKVFPCTDCGKVFGSRSSQQIHIRIHTGERPYACRYCDKAFADGGTLRKHERIHTGEKPYACPVCPKAFNQRVVLREHIRAHHAGNEPKSGQVNFFECKVCGYLFRSSIELCSHLVQHSDENTAKSRVVPVGPRKYKRRSKLGNRKDTWCLVEKVFTVGPGQSETESCEDDPMPTAEERAIQSITIKNKNDTLCSPPLNSSNPSLNKSPVKSFKIVNGQLLTYEQKSSKHVPNEPECAVTKQDLDTKTFNFQLKDGECARTCPSIHKYFKTLESETLAIGEDFKENDNPDDPEDQISVEDMDLTTIKIESNDQTVFTTSDYENMCNIEYNDQGEIEYYISNSDFAVEKELVLESVNDSCKIETELVFDSDYVEEVGANIELSTEEMAPVYAETISCDICDEEFEDRKELMRHIQTMHIG